MDRRTLRRAISYGNAVQFYPSSFRLGDHASRLRAMVGPREAKIALIPNALDCITETQAGPGGSGFDPILYFAEHGFDASIVDLRRYFGRPAALLQALLHYPIVWAVGGNAFLLRRAMRESGFDDIIDRLLAEDVIYAGWSAGACVAGTGLQAIRLMDDPNVEAAGYPESEPIFDGLGLVPFTIIPHYESNHPEARDASRAVDWAVAQGVPHLPLRDGEVVVMDGGEREVLRRSGSSATL
jgi:dipeptidase E